MFMGGEGESFPVSHWRPKKLDIQGDSRHLFLDKNLKLYFYLLSWSKFSNNLTEITLTCLKHLGLQFFKFI